MKAKQIALTAVLFIVCPLASATDDLAQAPAVADAIALLELWTEEQRAYQALPGLAIGVVHDQDLIWARGFGVRDLESLEPVTPDTVFRVGSVTKVFTATAILQLRDRGLLRLDDPVAQHLPWFSIHSDFEGEPEITVRHLLTHSSGLPREAAFPYWTTHEFPTREELQAVVPGQSTIFPPASRYKYSNLGIALLGEIVTEVSGTPWADFLRDHITTPLGMARSSADPDDALRRLMTTAYLRRAGDGNRRIAEYYDTGALAPAANMVSTVNDLARFAALQFSAGTRAEDAQILRASTLREMHRPHWMKADWSGGRGLGYSVSRRKGTTLVSHGGWVAGHRTHFLLAPSEKIAVIVMTNADDASPGQFSYRAYDLLAPAIASATAPPPEPKRVDPAWQRYLGTYSDPWGWEYQVLIHDQQLVFYEHSYPPEDAPSNGLTRLEPVSEHTFRMSDGELVVFELDDDGRVERIKRRFDYIYPVDPNASEADAKEGQP
ncbi:MAG: serine hydrolase [Acidobacteriota bacterium]